MFIVLPEIILRYKCPTGVNLLEYETHTHTYTDTLRKDSDNPN